MVMIALFGQTEVGPQAVAPPPPAAITPERFAAMAPHLRQELVLLMAERGMSRRDVATLLAVPPGEVDAVAGSRHQHRCFQPDRAEGARAPKRGDLPPRCAKLLKIMIDNGGEMRLSLHDMEMAAGLAPGSAAAVLKALRERGLAQCLARGGGRRASIWILTEKGRDLTEDHFAEAADA